MTHLREANTKYGKRAFAGCVLVSDNVSWVFHELRDTVVQVSLAEDDELRQAVRQHFSSVR